MEGDSVMRLYPSANAEWVTQIPENQEKEEKEDFGVIRGVMSVFAFWFIVGGGYLVFLR